MLALINPRRSPHQFLCGLLAALMALGPVPTIAQQPAKVPQPIDVEPESPRPVKVNSDATLLADAVTTDGATQPLEVGYAVPNTCVLVALRPARLLNSPMAELYPTEVLQAAGLQHLGLDPLAAESVVFALAPTIGGPPSYSAFIRFNKPFELKPSKLTEHAAPAEVAGKKYLQSTDPMLPSICALDEQSLLVAPDYFLRSLVASERAAPVDSFAGTFAATDRGDDLLTMVDVAPLRALINMGASQAPIPPEFTSAKQLPNLVRFIELRANLSRPASSSLLITANNEADAKKIVTIFNEIKQLLTAKWAIEAQKQLASEDPVEQAAGRYSLRMSRLVDDRIELEREREQLILFRGDLTGQGGNPLITTAVIGTLVGLLLPAVQAAREAARRNVSQNNLRQILLAMHMYANAKNSFPPYANLGDDDKPLLSWRVHLLPYLEQQDLYNKFHLDEPWDSEHNKQLISQMPEIYLDPSSGMAVTDGKTHYQAVKGSGYVFDTSGKGCDFQAIKDGMSNTMAIVQTGNSAVVVWTKPDDWQPDEKNLMKPFELLHPGGFLAGFADGSVRFIDYDVDQAVLKALLTIAGGEAIPPDSY